MYHLDRGNKNGGGVAIDDMLECLSVQVLLLNNNIVISCLHKHPNCTIDEFAGNL